MKNTWIKKGLPISVYIKGTLEGLIIVLGGVAAVYIGYVGFLNLGLLIVS